MFTLLVAFLCPLHSAFRTRAELALENLIPKRGLDRPADDRGFP
jgi:hypothetical protein